MNPLYLETYRRHRRLFLLPLVLGAAVAVWINLAAPKLYGSSASLWSETAGGASTASGAPPPAAQDQSMLNELLTTRYFRNTLARKSPLASYLEQHPAEGWGPSALMAKLKAAPTEDARIEAALSVKRVTSVVEGPHVLRINFEATSPTVAVATLRELVAEFGKQRNLLRRDALTTANDAVASASKTLSDVRTNLSAYRQDHPVSTSTDPQLKALGLAERNAVTQLGNATEVLNQATTAVLNGASVQTTLRVIDAPKLPTGPSTGKKRLLLAMMAGLFGGGLISILGILALAKAGRGRHEDDEGLDPDSDASADGAETLAAHRTRAEPTRLERAD
jgi:uncharacterized protein involved in exopolysaccharide biosynthesis